MRACGSGPQGTPLPDSGQIEYRGSWRGVCLLGNSMANVVYLPCWSSDNLSWKGPEWSQCSENLLIKKSFAKSLDFFLFWFCWECGDIYLPSCLLYNSVEGWPLYRLLLQIRYCWHTIMGDQLVILLKFSSWGNSMWCLYLKRGLGHYYPQGKWLGITSSKVWLTVPAFSCQYVVGYKSSWFLFILFSLWKQRFTY